MKNFAWSFGNTFLNKGFSFVFSVIIGNLLLPGELGLFVTLLLVVTYTANIFSLNLGGGIVQKMNQAEGQNDASGYFTAGLLGTAVLTLAGLSAFYLLRNPLIDLFGIPRAHDVISLTYPLLVLSMFRSYFSHVVQAGMQFKKLTLVNAVAATVQVLITLLLLYSGKGLAGVFWGLYSGNMVALVPLVYTTTRRLRISFSRHTLQSLRSLAGFSSMIYLGSVAVLLDQRIDLIFVAHFLENQEVAIYDYVLKFSLLFVLFGNSMSRVTYPRFTRAFTSGAERDINRLFSYSLNYTFFLLTIFSLLFFFHAGLVIDWILPSFYLQVIPYLLILLIGVIPKAVITSVGTLFTAKGIPSVSARINWILLGVNVVLNLLLIPRFGLYGAAIATTSSFLLKPVIMLALISRRTGLIYRYNKLLVNFLIFIAALAGGHLAGSYILKELILVAYMVYCYKIFLEKDEKQYLLSGWYRLNNKVFHVIR